MELQAAACRWLRAVSSWQNTRGAMPTLRPIVYAPGRLQLLDQRLLPAEEVYLDVHTCEDAHRLIREMAVRGAPAIAVAGFLALAVQLRNEGAGAQFASATDAADKIRGMLDYLVSSRPTAVNLLSAARQVRAMLDTAAAAPDTSAAKVTESVMRMAEDILAADVTSNKAIGRHGMHAMLQAAAQRGGGEPGKLRVLTHCNTGSLATVQYGTALGCIRALHENGRLERAYCTETRPYNQGARLTAYELVTEGIPATLIADSAAASLLMLGRVDAIVVGADRVAANGDTANKVGTCMLSVVAAAAGVPFFVAAPTTSIDPAIADGGGIEIEERDASELTHSSSHKSVRVVVEGIDVWNPAFDIARAANITGIITELGDIPKAADGSFAVARFLENGAARGTGSGADAPATPSATPASAGAFAALTLDTVIEYVARRPALAAHVGDASTSGRWTSREIGDGNINFVYLVEGPAGAVIVKQGLPYVRCVGESWPLSQERLRYEAESLREMHRHCPQHVVEVFDYDPDMHVISMQYLRPPHVVLRYGLLDGAVYPRLAAQVAEQLACCLFRTSQLALPPDVFRAAADRFSNSEMCRLTEQVIFTDPYYDAPHNRHTSPQLDDLAAALRADGDAKRAATEAKAKFCQNRQALLHGDLHTGSCMVTAETYFVIDSEFAFYGPIAFDVGKFIANVLLSFFALDGHSSPAQDRAHQRAYLLQVARDVWNLFAGRFVSLWDAEGLGSSLFPREVFGADGAAAAATQAAFMRALFSDALLFGGCVMVRRLVGIAHNADFERIADAGVRAVCERRALLLGRELLVQRGAFASIEAVAERAAELRQDGRAPCFPLMLTPPLEPK